MLAEFQNNPKSFMFSCYPSDAALKVEIEKQLKMQLSILVNMAPSLFDYDYTTLLQFF